MTQTSTWMDLVLTTTDTLACWQQIAVDILQQARSAPTPGQLHDALIPIDRLLAEAAWSLWEAFPEHAPHTIAALRAWWQARGAAGRAVLILDGLSLREVPLLLNVLTAHGVEPLDLRATAAEVPTDTEHFAAALGLAGRGALSNDHAPNSFILASDDRFTDVLSLPFGDCKAEIPPRRDVVIWQTWPDDLFKPYRLDADALRQAIAAALKDAGFWDLIAHLRQGRQLVITSDHGYATTDRFAITEDGAVKDYLVKLFGAMRMAKANDPLSTAFVPPPALTFGKQHVVIGQRRWAVPGGFPHVCHGGLSLLEAFSPFLSIPEAL